MTNNLSVGDKVSLQSSLKFTSDESKKIIGEIIAKNPENGTYAVKWPTGDAFWYKETSLVVANISKRESLIQKIRKHRAKSIVDTVVDRMVDIEEPNIEDFKNGFEGVFTPGLYECSCGNGVNMDPAFAVQIPDISGGELGYLIEFTCKRCYTVYRKRPNIKYI